MTCDNFASSRLSLSLSLHFTTECPNGVVFGGRNVCFSKPVWTCFLRQWLGKQAWGLLIACSVRSL